MENKKPVQPKHTPGDNNKPTTPPTRRPLARRPNSRQNVRSTVRSTGDHRTIVKQPHTKTQTKTYTTPTGDKVRVIVLGGLEEVGRNCTLIEYKNDIIIIDLGLQFPDEGMPGVDYIIPNMSYLKGKEKNVRGVIITHGHYDHIGAIPHTVPYIGNPTVYALPIAAGIIKKRQTDFKTAQINVKDITIATELQLGAFKVHFFHINHNIPDSAGIVVETPMGTICHTGDWKFDYHPVGAAPADLRKIARVGEAGVALLMGDSTNSDRPGHQTSERVIGLELERILEKAEGRVIIATFASLLSRVKQIMELSEGMGKKVALEGYSMKANVEIARALGFIKVSDKTIITTEQLKNYPNEKIVVICTGAQGEKNAALNRIANNEHRFIKLDRTDTVVFSSSVIPGNEQSVQKLKDTFYRKRAHVIHKDIMDVHAGGHAMQDDIKLMLSLFTPKYYMPIEGNHFLLRENQMVALSMGWKEENTFVADNGQVIEIWKDEKGESQARMTNEKVPSEYVFVDGLGVGDVSHVVLRDRNALADEGIVVAIVQVEKKTGKVVGTADIVSRGFVLMKDNKNLINETRALIQKVASNNDPNSEIDREYVRNQVRDEVGKFLFKKTERRPMILPVILEV
ncbi:ribonuclease J [Candidatus Uhrbacteria bacterium CG_4_10_14_0_2_um_filter_41_7]|uniref:Ribonuclease J n=1 Tax=Candidatus Uhrbacteria bacterium CG_4_9_14_3_um_filter_41_35 TaxID=1975034 RepID=A0A2M7XGD4_9BACT|nr:MAG: ribonuclease J [Candidatus Uhrbacteria bacterium CG11_big_fil_rev_8_21_14_0_20_41_9]PIZ54123.1 MAG: ribonuclease J [Candidatus Uhrbacteria bacterium CG_4_10_14_0_2_um_filter_41_7]PJA46931.1 MAG: ribonuclease J [Candidatus Uhrbacteria bacterium CG_4_9_14_3_um_filter_41_35]